jgi:hypothetical protein
MSSDPFPDYSAVLGYAKANDLEITWEHSPAFQKWQRKLAPEQFEVREVLHTRKGPTHVGLFAKALVRAERVANRERFAAQREAWRQRGGRRLG